MFVTVARQRGWCDLGESSSFQFRRMQATDEGGGVYMFFEYARLSRRDVCTHLCNAGERDHVKTSTTLRSQYQAW